MPSSLPLSVLEQLTQEQAHFDEAPSAFLDAWKQGVRLAGPHFFGDGQPDGLARAKSKWDLAPDLPRISRTLGVLSSGERVFIVALASFYNAHDSKELLRRAGVGNLADLGTLDLQRRQVIAALLLHDTGW
ncbi:hypothetical protein ACLQ9J_10315 [Bordetella hinzii]|uniref:hypothetical protein n=1 Tax=Bordetella hinzii TaxID=103855 RepID=UPI0039FBE27E